MMVINIYIDMFDCYANYRIGEMMGIKEGPFYLKPLFIHYNFFTRWLALFLLYFAWYIKSCLGN